jgi:hypothetical protein
MLSAGGYSGWQAPSPASKVPEAPPFDTVPAAALRRGPAAATLQPHP